MILHVCVIILQGNEYNLIQTYHWLFALLQKTPTILGLFRLIKAPVSKGRHNYFRIVPYWGLSTFRPSVFLLFHSFINIKVFRLTSEHPSVYALFLSIIVLHRQNEKWDNILLYFPSKHFFVKCLMILIGINSVSPPQRMSAMNHDKK